MLKETGMDLYNGDIGVAHNKWITAFLWSGISQLEVKKHSNKAFLKALSSSCLAVSICLHDSAVTIFLVT